MSFTTLINVAALRALLSPPPATAPAAAAHPVLLDCRFDLAAPDAGRDAYQRGHIPGAHYVDLNRDLAGPVAPDTGRHPLPAPEAFARHVAALGIAPGVQVVAYDAANGAFAARAWWLLRWLGHPQVAVLDGGLAAWVSGGGELTSAGTTGSQAQHFIPAVDTDAVVSTAELLRVLNDPSRLLVDARAAERYAGEVEPIDPVAGHVPGAVNHPFAANLAPDGRFLAPAELRRRWQQRLGLVDPENTILMCGSGVTACHDLLALEIAGLPGARLHAGSWSEWIRDPARPVARGR